MSKAMEFSLNRAELSLNSVNSENLRNHWNMNWVQYKDLLCYLCVCGLVVSSLSLTQEILGSSPTMLIFDFFDFFLSLNSANSVKPFRENSIVYPVVIIFLPNFNLKRDEIKFSKTSFVFTARNTDLIIKPKPKFHFTVILAKKNIPCVNNDTISVFVTNT